MAYDEGLATRVREAIGEQPGLTEKQMFGGLAFCWVATWPAACAATT
jgi:hypothetical protein